MSIGAFLTGERGVPSPCSVEPVRDGAAPVLTGQALEAVRYRGGHLQIIASAGSGKTEVVAQRVADLLATGVDPGGVVAFTFTERAAAELKERISLRVVQRSGQGIRDQLSRMYVGTIHAYCFAMLQAHVPRFETYDVLDDHQLTAFLARGARVIGVAELDPRGRMFKGIERFLRGMSVVDNELLDISTLPAPFALVAERFLESLQRYRLLTFGQQIVEAVRALEDPAVAERVTAGLRHLIVDEYQDVNPAQEALIRALAGRGAEVCVVGDDDQAIYQWRGSDVANIVRFTDRYPGAASFTIADNYRSRSGIVELANAFATTIPGRLPKQMRARRGSATPEVSVWSADTEAEESHRIAETVVALHDDGRAYRDIAILVRGRTSYPHLLAALADHGVPVQPAGRTGLFDQPEARLLARTYCWLADIDWRPHGYGARPERVDARHLWAEYASVFGLPAHDRPAWQRLLTDWQSRAMEPDAPIDLIEDYYRLLDLLRCRDWDDRDPIAANRLGTLARFSTLLADFEAVRRRARPSEKEPGGQVGGENHNAWYHRNLAIHLINYAQGAYAGFDGEPAVLVDAVDLTTVHQAKGLEWPVVFVPGLTSRRFPSAYTGREQDWPIPRDRFDAARYEGRESDERRLFYVALTRARDWVSVSRHDRPEQRVVAPSPFFLDLTARVGEDWYPQTPSPVPPGGADREQALTIGFSDLATYDACGASFRLRHLLGFQPRLAPELGYGKAVHHVLRVLADTVRTTGALPTPMEIDHVLDTDFYLPAANKPAHRQMKAAARRLVTDYASDHAEDLYRVWQTERPLELHLDQALVTGRADLILDRQGGRVNSLALVDYKVSTRSPHDHALQLRVYAAAGRREGLDIQAAYIHDLTQRTRIDVDLSDTAVARAQDHVSAMVDSLRAGAFDPAPGPACRGCDVRAICRTRVDGRAHV